MFNQDNFQIRTPENTRPTAYGIPNVLTTQQAQNRNIMHGVAYQGYSFAIPVGASVQALQIPGDCSEILGFAMSFSETVGAGINNTVTISLNNQTIFNAINIQYFNVNRLNLPPGYIAVNRITSPTSNMSLAFANGTVAAVASANFIIVYH